MNYNKAEFVFTITRRDNSGKVSDEDISYKDIPAYLNRQDNDILWIKRVNHYNTPIDSIGSLEDFLERFPEFRNEKE